MLARPADWMPKLASIAREVCLRRQKAVVLISRQGGYRAMLAHMQQAAAAAVPPFTVASGEQLAQFNAPSNARGEVLSVLVVDSSQFGEGTSFLNVRWLYLADVPGTAAAFQQQCGRVSRMFGHSGLPAEERSVSFSFFLGYILFIMFSFSFRVLFICFFVILFESSIYLFCAFSLFSFILYFIFCLFLLHFCYSVSFYKLSFVFLFMFLVYLCHKTHEQAQQLTNKERSVSLVMPIAVLPGWVLRAAQVRADDSRA